MRKSYQKFLQLRNAVPFFIVLALVLATVGEMAYQRALTTLRYGIAVNESRLRSARILQLLADAETGQRGYLLTGNAASLEPMKAAQRELRDNQKLFEFIANIGPTGPGDAQQIYQLATQKIGELERAISLANRGDRAAALELVDSAEGTHSMALLRASLERKFSEAEKLRDDARSAVRSALLLIRTAVLLLLLLLALGMYWYWRKLQQLDRSHQSRHQVLEAEVAIKTEELRTLAGYLQTVREDEKSYLARELHDELGGLLTSAKLTLARMRVKLADDAQMLERIEQVNRYINGGIELKRKIIENLRPSTLSTLGLNVALATMCAETSGQLGLTIQTNIAAVNLSPDIELGIYRIVQEALTNIGKYAEATKVSVELQQTDSEILLDIKDNGHGFDLATLRPGQHGLGGMRFRVESFGGKMVQRSAPGEGVHIAIRLPWRPPLA